MRTVRFIMTGPPTADVGAFVRIVDDEGNPVTVGWWQHNGQAWEFIMPVRMVPELVVPNAEPLQWIEATPSDLHAHSPVPRAAPVVAESDAQRRRRELKDRLKSAPKKEATMMEPATGEPPPGWEKCPSCEQPFNPQTDELMDCGTCGEPKCTARCMPNPVEPCKDCKALEPDEGEGYSAPPSQAVFGGKQINDPETMRRLGAAAVEADDDDDADNGGGDE